MECSVRARRVAVPLGDVARARLIGSGLDYASSGSEHDAEDDSPFLSELVHGFFDDDYAAGGDCKAGSHSDNEAGGANQDRMDADADAVKEIIANALSSDGDAYRIALSACVTKAVGLYSCWWSNKSVMLRQVMSYLREAGYTAAVCKTKWSASGGLTAGNYEFVDVVHSERRQLRYFVDLDFRGEFEIARPTDEYSELLASIPSVFVGRSDDLKPMVRAMCDAVRRSLKSRGLSVPPWRNNRYMQNRWLGPYRRTTNPFQAAGVSISPVISSAFGCRSIGGGSTRRPPPDGSLYA